MASKGVVDVKDMTLCGWQFGKSLAECNRYMLDNQLTTDVYFEVGLPDAARGVVRAHKYVLMSRSSVFEALFCRKAASETMDEYTSETKIQVCDMEASIFKEVVR